MKTKRQRTTIVLVVALLTFSLLSSSVLAYDLDSGVTPEEARLYVNGRAVTSDVTPREVNGQLMIPFRAIFEAADANVSWDGKTRTVTAESAGLSVRFHADNDHEIDINGRNVRVATAPHIFNSRTLVPLKLVREALGSVEWHADPGVVTVSADGVTDVWVQLQDFTFDPETVTAAENERVRFYLYGEGVQPHTFTVDALGIDKHVDAGHIGVVETTMPRSGTFELVCRYHIGLDMTGQLEVQSN